MDAGVRMEGLPALFLWDLVIDVFDPHDSRTISKLKGLAQPNFKPKELYDMFGSVDYVPPSLPVSFGSGKLYVLEDNDANKDDC